MLVLYPTSLLLFAGVTLAFPDGAPSDTCLNMYPKHKGMEQQDTVPPFDITLSSNLYIPGQTITVNISAKQGHAFRGIQMRAHRANMGEIVGTFIGWPRDKLRPINCFGISNSMLTHTNNVPVTSTVVEWRPPEHNLGTLIFTFTLLEEFQVFWYGIQSTRLESANSSTDLLSSVQPETNISFGQIEWSLCGETKGCLLYPRHCSGADCYSALTFSKGPDGYTFELMGEGEGYVSVGFSHDRSMGGEHTITCTADGNRVTIQSGYNHKELFNERLITTDLKNLQTKQEDGKIYCRFTRQEMMNIVYSVDEAGHVMSTYSDLSIDYYVFLASGYTYHNSDVMKIHTELPIITDDKVDFKHYAVYYGGILPVKTKVHAALMVVAWMGMAGLTAVLARHFRNGCGSNYILGVQLWFHLHRLCALLAFGLTVTGLVLILVSLEGKVTKDTAIYNHACVGFTVCALVCAQILLGLLRPSPDFRFRYVFNYAHRILGKIAQILSAVTLMLAFQPVWMPRVMRQFGVIVVAVWIAVQVVAEVLLEVWHCYTNRRTKSADIDLDGEHSDEQLALPDPSSVPFLIYLLIPLAAAIAGLCSVLLF